MSTTQPQVSLLQIPAELRLIIYGFATDDDAPRWVFTGTADWQEDITIKWNSAYALEETCTLTRREIRPMLPRYRSSFVVLRNFTPSDAERWCARYQHLLDNIQRLIIDLWGGCAYSDWIDGHRDACSWKDVYPKVCSRGCDRITNNLPLSDLLKERYGLCRRRVDIDFVATPENRFQVSGCVGEDGIHGPRSIVTECAYNCFGRAFVCFTSDFPAPWPSSSYTIKRLVTAMAEDLNDYSASHYWATYAQTKRIEQRNKPVP